MNDNGPVDMLDLAEREFTRQELSKSTKSTYTLWIKNFLQFAGSRLMIDESLPNEYLRQVALKGKSIASQKQCISALRLLYRHILNRPFNCEGLPAIEVNPRQIELIEYNEVKALAAVQNDDASLITLLIYGTGLRLNEVVALRVESIHFKTRSISAKIQRDKARHVLLPNALIDRLRNKIDAAKGIFSEKQNDKITTMANGKKPTDICKAWLFPGRDMIPVEETGLLYWQHLNPDTFSKTLAKSSLDLLGRKITPVMLRISFAFALFEQNCSRQTIMRVMGYKNINSVQILLKAFAKIKRNHEPISPLDFYPMHIYSRL